LLAAGTVLVNSRFTQKNINEIYGRQGEVCYLGVDTGHFCPGTARREDFFLSVGRLGLAKGHDFVLKVLANLPEQLRELRVIADSGDGEERSRLEDLARQCEVRLRLLSRISDEEVVKAYQTCKAVVCAQVREPFGFVPLEAMACATPVFAVKEGGLQETIRDGETGFHIPRQPEEAAKIVAERLEKGFSQDFLSGLRSEAESQWSWEAHAERLKAHILACKP
jgi:glycosyltransferase involved in cell wall biosynthesis